MTDTEAPTQEALLKAINDHDSGQEAPDTPATPPVPVDKLATDKAPDKPTDKPTVSEQKPQQEAAVKSPEAKEDKATEADKPKSKWAQNEERKARTWEQINGEKARIDAEKKALEQARAELEAKRNAATAAQPYRDDNGFTAEDYRNAEKMFREKGDAANADAAKQLADAVAGREQQHNQKRAQEQFQSEWNKHLTATVEKYPALKDQNSDLYKEAVKVLQESPLLSQRPDGITYAVKAADLLIRGKDIDNTRAENTRLKAELEKLQSKLSIGTGAPTAPTKPAKSFEQMSKDEQAAELLKSAQQLDREAGYGA